MNKICLSAIISLCFFNMFGSTAHAAEDAYDGKDFNYSAGKVTAKALKIEAEKLGATAQSLRDKIAELQLQLNDVQFQIDTLIRRSQAKFSANYWELEPFKLGEIQYLRDSAENRRFFRSNSCEHRFTRSRTCVANYYDGNPPAISVKEFAESLRNLELRISSTDSEILIPIYSGGDVHFCYVNVEEAIKF